MTHLVLLLLTLIPLVPPDASASEILDDLQVDAMIAITRLRTDSDTPDTSFMKQLEALYAAGESSRNAGDHERAADRFRQILSLVREHGTVPPSPTAPPPPVPEEPTLPVLSPPIPPSPLLVGTEGRYAPTRRESLPLISARLGVSSRLLASLNGLSPRTVLSPGQEIVYRNLRIVPKVRRNGIVINIPDRTLYLFRNGTLVKTVPVAVGKGNKEKNSPYTFETPTGPFRIVARKRNPSWRVPPSIREEMATRNISLPEVVPPGKDNPLGGYALVTSIPGILIHSTNSPASVYGFSSHGCIRVTPWEMERLFHEIPPSSTGEIIYEPIKVLVVDGERVFLEVNPDIYRKVKDPERTVKRMLVEKGADHLVDWSMARWVIREKRGVAEEVTHGRLNAERRRDHEPTEG